MKKIICLFIAVFIMFTSICEAAYIPYKLEVNENAPARRTYDIAYCNGRYVIVGDYGLILVSEDLENWNYADYVTSDNLYHVISDGNVFIANSSKNVFSSEDGYTWKVEMEQTPDFLEKRSISSIYPYTGEGGGFIVRTDFGACYVTQDFINYTANNDGNIGKMCKEYDENTHKNVYNESGTLVDEFAFWNGYYINNLRYTQIQYSTDEENWTTVQVVPEPPETAIELADTASVPSGRELIRYGNTGVDPIYHSTDGENWIEIEMPNKTGQMLNEGDRTGLEGAEFYWWEDRYIFIEGTGISAVPERALRQIEDMIPYFYIMVFDEDFNFITYTKIEEYVIDAAYRDGLYFYKNLDKEVYKSSDLTEWTLDNTEGKMPFQVYENKNIIIDEIWNADKTDSQRICYFKNGDERIPVKYEAGIPGTGSTGDLLYYNNTNSLMVSRDGIYYSKVYSPARFGTFKVKDDRLCSIPRIGNYWYTDYWTLSYSLDDIYSVLPPENTPYIKLNGDILAFDTPPVIEDDRILVPMRFIFENMGAEVEWDNWVSEASVTKEDNNITFAIGSNKAVVNGKTEKMDVPARNINSRTMIPLRFLSENLGYKVTWDQENRTASIEN